MIITFVGNHEVDYSTESHHAKTFEKMGHKVIRIQENKTNKNEVMENVVKSDMLYHTHTHGDNWRIEGIKDVYAELKKRGIPSVGYHLDLFKGIEREILIDIDPYWNIEYFFTVDKLFVPDLEKRGIKAFYLPPGVFEDECYFGEKRPELQQDVVFVGSRGYHPEWAYRPQLIEWLEKTYGDRFTQWGGGGKGTIRGKDLNDLYASAKVVIGDTLCKGFDYPYYFSDRLFEATGRGAFMIFPYIKGLEDHFKLEGSDRELVTYKFGDFDGLKRTIDLYLDNEEERELIRLRGNLRARTDHTYTKRLQYLLETINNERKS
jgi:hypothetical protein